VMIGAEIQRSCYLLLFFRLAYWGHLFLFLW
jgi:hypothetical protein